MDSEEEEPSYHSTRSQGESPPLLLLPTRQYGANNDDVNHNDIAASFRAISRRHYRSTAAMCLCTFTHSWLLVSVFPYSGFMAISLMNGMNEENVGPYAGLLAAAFMIGRALTSFLWGRMGDMYGRRIVLFLSLLLSSVFSILFGLSTSFVMAFGWRFLLGASNGIAGISKAIVSETAQGYDMLETRGMSLSMGMWAWGFLLGPALAGFVSDPIRQYPSLFADHESGLYRFLHAYPFFLPNLISIFLCLVDILAVHLWVPETLPARDQRHPKYMFRDVWSWIHGHLLLGVGKKVGVTLGEEENDDRFRPLTSDTGGEQHDHEFNNHNTAHETDNQNFRNARLAHTESVSLLSTSSPFPLDALDDQMMNTNPSPTSPPSQKATMKSLWNQLDTRRHLILYWAFSFVAIAIDEAFPLFCISKEGGLGLSENTIGKLLSATGLLFAISQYHVYAWIVDKYGLAMSIQLGAVLSAPLAAFIPMSLWLNGDSTSDLTWAAFTFLSLLLAACRIFGLVFFSSITIATNRTVIPSHRGTVNGLSMLGGSCAKGLGPIVAGSLVGFGISSGVFKPQIGSFFVFGVIGLCAAVTAVACLVILGKTSDEEVLDAGTNNVQRGHDTIVRPGADLHPIL